MHRPGKIYFGNWPLHAHTKPIVASLGCGGKKYLNFDKVPSIKETTSILFNRQRITISSRGKIRGFSQLCGGSRCKLSLKLSQTSLVIYNNVLKTQFKIKFTSQIETIENYYTKRKSFITYILYRTYVNTTCAMSPSRPLCCSGYSEVSQMDLKRHSLPG